MVGIMHRRKLHDTREASNGGRVRVRIIHGLNISHKELTYLLQKSTSYQNQALCACSQGGGWQELTIARPRPPHKGRHSMNISCFKFVTQRLPYVHAMGLANLNTSISQFHNYSTIMTLISPPLYRKTIARNQTYHIPRSTSFMQDFMTNHVNDQFLSSL